MPPHQQYPPYSPYPYNNHPPSRYNRPYNSNHRRPYDDHHSTHSKPEEEVECLSPHSFLYYTFYRIFIAQNRMIYIFRGKHNEKQMYPQPVHQTMKKVKFKKIFPIPMHMMHPTQVHTLYIHTHIISIISTMYHIQRQCQWISS